jgi:hypothetical protein
MNNMNDDNIHNENILSMNNMSGDNIQNETTIVTRSERVRLCGKLPVEVEAIIKEYAQPRYKISAHFKAMNTLFRFQKGSIMPIVMGLACPECNHPLLQTRLNSKYRRAQIKYNKKPIGEVYEDLVLLLPGLVEPETFMSDILRSSRTLKFDTDKHGRTIECSSAPLNCCDIYCEIAAAIVIALPLLALFVIPARVFIASLPSMLFIVLVVITQHIFDIDWVVLEGWTIELDDL